MRTVLTLKFLGCPLDRISIEILLIMCFYSEKNTGIQFYSV